MAVMMIMEWRGVTPDQYDQVREIVRWEQDVPQGAMFHVIAFDDDGARVTDVWDSADDFQRFVDERLMPGTKQAGIVGEPQVTILPTHRIFAPAFEGARA